MRPIALKDIGKFTVAEIKRMCPPKYLPIVQLYLVERKLIKLGDNKKKLAKGK